MRLIDANELLRALALEPMKNRTYWRANEIVLDQPIAYDIEDIIKQLEKEKERQKENAIDDFKIRFFCELNNRVVRPIFSKQIQSQFTIDDIKSIFDEIVEQLRVGEQE